MQEQTIILLHEGNQVEVNVKSTSEKSVEDVVSFINSQIKYVKQ